MEFYTLAAVREDGSVDKTIRGLIRPICMAGCPIGLIFEDKQEAEDSVKKHLEWYAIDCKPILISEIES